MARINTYNIDDTINPLDKVIGTDANDNSKTKNFTIADLNDYFSLNPPPGGFIPLSGTTEGNPVTGDIEFNPDNQIYKIFKTNTDELFNGEISFQDTFLQIKSNSTFNENILSQILFSPGNLYISTQNGILEMSSLNIDNLGFNFSPGSNASKGLFSSIYFGANYDDNTYVQKKYVDDAIAENSPIVREKITITGSAFRTLNSSPVTLIPAPGAGKIIQLNKVLVSFVYGSVTANYATGGIFSITYLTNSGSPSLNSTSNSIRTYEPQSNIDITENTAITLSAIGSDATVGDSTLNVYVTYEIITL